MLNILTDLNEIANSQALLEKQLKNQLKYRKKISISSKGGSFPAEIIHNDRMWYCTFFVENENKFVNEFGLFEQLESNNKSTVPVVEINIPYPQIRRNIAGAFAINENGNVMLIHRGRLTTGGYGFRDWYKKQLPKNVEIVSDRNERKEVIIVGEISSKNFIEHLLSFIQHVVSFKELLKETSILIPQNLLPDFSSIKFDKIERVIFVHKRKQHIVEKAKELANGKCQLCGCYAPFKGEEGEPYLEVHHVQWLSHNGADSLSNVVALCPNCHRKMHVLNLEEDVEKLTKIAKSQK